MDSDLIPDDLEYFILNQIDSIAQLEALLLLRETCPQNWTAMAVAQRIYTDEPTAEQVLARLCGTGLVVHLQGAYRYGCTSSEQRQLVDRLADAYSKFLIPVTNIIHAKPRRIREFAEAFKLRKDT